MYTTEDFWKQNIQKYAFKRWFHEKARKNAKGS